MGMFDTVWATCPACGDRVGFQSKAGECILRDYAISSVPPEIAADINGEWGQCEGCHKSFKIKLPGEEPSTVAMTLDA